MLFRLLLLFTIVPFVELAILLLIAQHTHWLVSVGLVVGTGLLGAWLARREGLRCWRQAREKIEKGELPTDALLDGLLIFLAGTVLITPGIITDLLGFALLTPPLRQLVRRPLASRILGQVALFHPADLSGRWQRGADDEPIDVESRPVDSMADDDMAADDVIDVESRPLDDERP